MHVGDVSSCICGDTEDAGEANGEEAGGGRWEDECPLSGSAASRKWPPHSRHGPASIRPGRKVKSARRCGAKMVGLVVHSGVRVEKKVDK
jgi:hypothetical protein